MDDETRRHCRSTYDTVADEYVRRIFDELKDKPLDRQLLDRFAAGVRNVGPACDLGCGPGHVARYLHEQGVQVCGIDLSPVMVEQARRLTPAVEFRQGDLSALDVADGAWAGVAAFYSLIHIPNSDLPQGSANFAACCDRAACCSRRSTSATRRCTWTSGGATRSQ